MTRNPAVATYLANQLEVCGKTQVEVAEELGYQRPNIITMFKQGKTKIPISVAPRLAKAIGVDPNFFLRMVMNEYMPEVLAAIDESMGHLASEHEAKILEIIRAETGDADPRITTKAQEQAFRKAAKLLV